MSVSRSLVVIAGIACSLALCACDLFASKSKQAVADPEPQKQKAPLLIRFQNGDGSSLSRTLRASNLTDGGPASLYDSQSVEIKRDLDDQKYYFTVGFGADLEPMLFSIQKDPDCPQGYSLGRAVSDYSTTATYRGPTTTVHPGVSSVANDEEVDYVF